MNILHVFGGIRTFKIAKWQNTKGLNVGIITIDDEKPFESYYKGTAIGVYKSKLLTKIYEKLKGKQFLATRAHLFLYPFYLMFIRKMLKKIKPDIAHAYRHTGAFLTILAKKMSGLKTKLVFDYQDTWSGEDINKKSILKKIILKMFYSFEKYIIKHSDLIVTQGEEQTALLVNRYGITRDKITYTLNTADKDVFKVYKNERAKLRKEYGITGTAVLYLGSIVESHGVDMLPQAAKKVVMRYPNTKFVMMGVIRDKKLWDAIKAEIISLGLENNFVEIYPEKKGDIPRFISMCDVGLILHKKGSLIGELSIPSKLFEYMSCGLAVVISNLKHITHFVIPNRAGVAFEPNDTKSLSEALITLLKDCKKIARMGINSRKAVETKYNWDVDMERLLNAYKVLTK
jgi:glycosyltransferase involved in cell wall biosynthesis